MKQKLHGSQSGTTLIESLVIVAILGIVVAASALMLRPLESATDTGTALLEGFLRQARLNAIATTSAYRVSAATSSRLRAESSASCSATTWTTDADLSLTLPSGVTLSNTSWQICFSSRGISGNNVTITLQHPSSPSRRVEVLVGGTTRVLP